MNILGLHFGHDASLTLVRDGRIVSHVLVERDTRAKQCVGIRTQQLQKLLDDAGMRWEDVDVCGVVSTQDLELLTGLIDGFTITPRATAAHTVPSPFADMLAQGGMRVDQMLANNLSKVVKTDGEAAVRAQRARWEFILPEWQDLRDDKIESLGWLNAFTTHPRWQAQRTLDQIRDEPVDPATFSDAVRLGMHYPVEIIWNGVAKPGYFIDHHVCHAASAYYRSGFDRSAIITHDGGDATRGISGLFAYGEGHQLFVVSPHHLALGGIYRNTGIAIGFDLIGAEGKLMGLSSYGRSRFFDHRFVGNCFDVQNRFGKSAAQAWFEHCLAEGRARGYALEYGSSEHVLSDFCKDVAASTQKLFEQSYLMAANTLYTMLTKTNRRTSNLCLSGGAALNCPSNSALFNDAPYAQMFVEPNCDDGGLSVGAALYLFHNMLGQPVDKNVAAENRSPYLGLRIATSDIDATLAEARTRYTVERPGNPAEAAARDIQDNQLLAWFEGRSELGPRALCHRSLLASPLRKENWEHVNEVKGREFWRPLAPVVLEEDVHEWFAECPGHSPYMLFTARTRSRGIPAVTHVDGTARIQTVSKESGMIFEVLTQLRALSGCSVSINTSLNRRGEPIVDTPQQALDLFDHTRVDVLYLEGWRISRQASPAES
ncbi:MAG: carbamoyltransferase C-terminal domain-containing protein [Gammaproteobacteria bacterium]